MSDELTLNGYQQAALKNALFLSDADRLANAVLGSMGEAAEIARYILANEGYPANLETMLRWCVVFGNVAQAMRQVQFQGHSAITFEIAAQAMADLERGDAPSVNLTSFVDPVVTMGNILRHAAIATDALGHRLGDMANADLDALGRIDTD